MNSIQDCYVLSNGNKIPCVGFGTWNLTESSTTVDIIKTAMTADTGILIPPLAIIMSLGWQGCSNSD